MRLSNRIVLASSNQHKFFEFRALLASYPDIELVTPEGLVRNLDKLGLVENHDTYVENAIEKARLVNHASHYPSLADDSGLEVMALDGRPGARSRRYASPRAGIPQDRANIEKLLQELKDTPPANRQARFVAAVALVIEGILIHATGTLQGTIIDTPRGTNGFGYDPIFVPTGSQRTLAEMSEGEKNQISHRSKALHELMSQIKTRGIVFVKP